jgi:uncharacterized protein (TIGR03086 family)
MLKTTVDLEPAARRMALLVGGVRDGMLHSPTPCDTYTVGDLLDHIGDSVLAFTEAAQKAEPASPRGRPGDESRLGDDWRSRIGSDLASLVEAWGEPAAWQGMTKAAGVDLPAEVAGRIVLDELVIHGWDLARATQQRFECDDTTLDAVLGFVQQFAEPGQEASREGLFGPVVGVPDDAPVLDRILGMTGRDPGWTPPA